VLAALFFAAAIETVGVESRSLSGTWKIEVPRSAALDGLGSAKFGALGESYCRIAQSGERLKIYCLGPYLLKDGEGRFDGTALHLA
jgi:hypothetical protein